MALSHLSDDGEIHMVDISDKDRSTRRAQAQGELRFPDGVLKTILEEGPPKGDLFATGRLAGIQGAKKTPDLIPLAHPIQLSHVEVDLDADPEQNRLVITSDVKATDATGVEMEALTAVNTSALAIYDMCKSEHKGIEISSVRLLKKEGGSSGTWSVNDE